MNEMIMARLIAEEVVNELVNRGIITVRGTSSYDPDKRINVVNEHTVGYDDVVKAANEAVNNGNLYSSSRSSLLNIVPSYGDQAYYRAIIAIIKDANTLPSSKLDNVKRVTAKFGYK